MRRRRGARSRLAERVVISDSKMGDPALARTCDCAYVRASMRPVG